MKNRGRNDKKKEEELKGTISRVLSSRPRSSAGIGRMAIYLGSSLLRTSSDLTRPVFPPPGAEGNSNGLFFPLRERGLFGLAPGGVYPAAPIAQGTGELLPRLFTLTLWNIGFAYSTGRYIFCGTFLTPGLSTGGSPRYGPPCPAELGLSSPPDSQKERPSVPPRLPSFP